MPEYTPSAKAANGGTRFDRNTGSDHTTTIVKNKKTVNARIDSAISMAIANAAFDTIGIRSLKHDTTSATQMSATTIEAAKSSP
jgi:hypothetical protein